MDKIDEMNAQELRIEIAKKRGYVCKKESTYFVVRNIADFSVGYGWTGKQAWKNALSMIEDYPSDITSAWKLVEEMTELDYVEIVYGFYSSDKKTWRCTADNPHKIIIGNGDTALIAICRAWLKWKENSNE